MKVYFEDLEILCACRDSWFGLASLSQLCENVQSSPRSTFWKSRGSVALGLLAPPLLAGSDLEHLARVTQFPRL